MARRSLRLLPLLLALLTLGTVYLHGQVSYDRIVNAAKEPQNWLTYSGTFSGQRYSLLDQINLSNAKNLEMKWIFQAQSLQSFETSPIVVDGVMYITQAPNDVVALDAKTGRAFWVYRYNPSPDSRPCCGRVNRGLAILGDTLYMGTIDSRLIALNAKSGRPLWNIEVAKPKSGYSIMHAPLVIKDKVLVGVAGGELGIRGFLAAYDAQTGKEMWRFYTIPAPGEPGSETWSGDNWKTGGGPIWLTGSYDPELNLTYWGTGNPGPDYNPAQRPGDNLYASSLIALDADTGKLKWHFQFTPSDPFDYDATQIPVLVDMDWNGAPRKLMLFANRNGFFYVLDRVTGKFLLGKPFVKVTWASGLTEQGRPIRPTEPPVGIPVYPGTSGGTNFYSPSYSPRTGLFYVSVWENYGSVHTRGPVEYKEGQGYGGGSTRAVIPGMDKVPSLQRGPINTWTEALGTGAVLAIDPRTGEKKWKFDMTDVNSSGLLTTASDVLFSGGREGYFHALNARTGALLWRTGSLGGQVAAQPVTYLVDGKQYVAIAAGNGLFAFALRD